MFINLTDQKKPSASCQNAAGSLLGEAVETERSIFYHNRDSIALSRGDVKMQEEFEMNLHIEKIGWQQVEAIYHTYMEEDFGGHGLKPLTAMKYLWDLGCYEGICLYEETVLRAYALFAVKRETGCLLLDYLAVCGQERGKGYGGKFLAMMRDYFSEEKGILLETESVSSSPDEEEFRIRSRRRRFYLKNGCCPTRVKSLLFGGEYDILYIPIKAQQVKAEEELEKIYRLMFPEHLYHQYVTVWKNQSWLERTARWKNGKLQEQKSLLEALGGPDRLPRIISLVGGGGKTTTMYQLADELAEQGRRVLVTTTTHIGEPAAGQVLLIRHVSELHEDSWQEKVLTAGIPVMDKMDEMAIHKLSMPEGLDDPKELERLLCFADVILIEADGAKCKPLKVPRDGEPVILPQTGMVIACAGLSALGRTFEEACFRFENQGRWLARAASDRIAPEDAALILMDERGSRKMLGGRYYKIILNQADCEERVEGAKAVIRALPVTMQKDCIITAYGQKENSVII